MPFFTFILRILGRKFYILEMKNHLQSRIPKLFLQIYEHRHLKPTIPIKKTLISPLLRRSKVIWVTLDEWMTGEIHKMYALIKISRCFKIDDCTIEYWNDRINESFGNIV